MRIIKNEDVDVDSLSDFDRDQIYNGRDCCVTHDVFAAIHQQLDEDTTRTYALSRSLQGPVLEMGIRGVLVDLARRDEVMEDISNIIDRLEHQLQALISQGLDLHDFNWRSHAHLQRLFYTTLGIKPITKQGRPTTDRGAREKLAAYPVAAQLIAHINTLTELGDKYSVLKTSIDRDGRIRTRYNIAGTSTGRFSSSLSEFGTGGNLQNIEESIRPIFIADPGHRIAKFDAKSGESFCVGAVEWNRLGDPRYLDACESGDPHTAAARIVWPELPWTGNLRADKAIAERPFYRDYSYRFMCKKLGHGCLTPEHQVLTRSGWVSIADKPSEILTWRDGCSDFSPVSFWADFEYTGELHQFEGNSISAVMTNDHRIPYKKDLRQHEIYVEIAQFGPREHMPLGDDYIGGDEQVPARLIAAFMADGYQDKYSASFHFRKQRKVERLCELCEQYGYTYSTYENSDNSVKIYIKVSGWPKHPGPFMFNWTSKCLREFLDELKYWDGHISDTSVSISSTKLNNLLWYQTFGRILGIGGQISGPYTSGFGSEVYRLQQNNRKWANGRSIRWGSIHVDHQRVLCPTVATGWFYTRRDGRIFITGNSNYGGKPFTLAEQTRLDIALVTEFQRKYFLAFPAHQIWQADVDRRLRDDGYLISLLGRKRWFFGRRNEASTLREAIAYDPQSSLRDIVSLAMIKIWREGIAILLTDEHDALTFMYPEKDEDRVIPILLSALVVPIPLAGGRTLRIPYDAEVGWNKGHYHPTTNPDGLRPWAGPGADTRRRLPIRNPLLALMSREVTKVR